VDTIREEASEGFPGIFGVSAEKGFKYNIHGEGKRFSPFRVFPGLPSDFRREAKIFKK
jgi:hypothetical protein